VRRKLDGDHLTISPRKLAGGEPTRRKMRFIATSTVDAAADSET